MSATAAVRASATQADENPQSLSPDFALALASYRLAATRQQEAEASAVTLSDDGWVHLLAEMISATKRLVTTARAPSDAAVMLQLAMARFAEHAVGFDRENVEHLNQQIGIDDALDFALIAAAARALGVDPWQEVPVACEGANAEHCLRSADVSRHA